MLQTLNNNNSTNNAMYINPKKMVLSKWCASHNLSPSSSSPLVVSTTTTTSSSIKGTTPTSTTCTVPTTFHSTPHFSLPSQHSNLQNNSSSWSVVHCDEDYFKKNNVTLSTTISLTYSRDDTSCLEPQNGGIVLYSSLRYLLKHNFKLTSTNNTTPTDILFMKIDLIGGTIKEKINGVISCNKEMATPVSQVFSSDSRLQIEKVQSYKQAVNFRLSLYGLSDLENAICILESVSFNVFARKKQDNGSASPKTKKAKNPPTKRSPTYDDNVKSSKQPKIDSFSNTVSYSIGTQSPFVNTEMPGFSVNSLSLLANVLTDPTLMEDDEDEDHSLQIDDGEEPTNSDIHLLSEYEQKLKELISHINLMTSEERALALKSAVAALK